MLLMGDEVRRTQRGNNNAYCQDNEISWFDWTLLEPTPGSHRFVKTLVGQRWPSATSRRRTADQPQRALREADIQPHGITLNHPDLRPDSHSLAVTVRDTRGCHAARDVQRVLGTADVELPPARRGDGGSTRTARRPTT